MRSARGRGRASRAGSAAAAARVGPAPALVILAAGGGLAVLATGPSWDSVTVTRAAPLAGFTLGVSGRTIEPAVTGLGVVALAGVVALLATRGPARRVIGAVIMLAGGLLGWRAGNGLGAVSVARARDLVVQARTGTTLDAAAGVRVSVHRGWPALAIVAAALVVLAGALVVVHAGRWSVMGARYDPPVTVPVPAGESGTAPDGAADGDAVTVGVAVPSEADSAAGAADLAMWKSLDRGDDPTV